MRLIVLMILLGSAGTAGCGGTHNEVRVDSSMTEGSTQQKLDNMAAGLINGLLGGPPR